MPDDLEILQHWYNNQSGGLLLEGLDLSPDAESLDKETSKEYERAGFNRSRRLFTLKNDSEMVALIVINQSDLGMNMSDLTNCIQTFVLDQEQCSREMLSNVLSILADHFEHEEVPVLLYPESYADSVELPYDKTYELTVLDLQNISPYLQFMHSLTAPREKKVKQL